MTPRANQRGVALVTAMFIIAIVATLAAFLAVSQQVWLRQAQNLADLGQADGITRGAIELAGIALIEDAKLTKIDTLAEKWNEPIVLPVDGGFVTIQAKDAQSQFNLNNLVTGPAGSRVLNPTEIGVFEQLLLDLGLDASLKGALIDWLDGDSNVDPGGGAEDLEYASQPTPYRTANQALESVDELKRVKGFTPEVIDKLRDYVAALPSDRGVIPLNVNTADSKTVAAVMRVPAAALESAAGNNSIREFANKQDFDKLFPGTPQNRGNHDVLTNFFIVKVRSTVGRITRSTDALVERNSGKFIVHWQQPSRFQIARKEEPDA